MARRSRFGSVRKLPSNRYQARYQHGTEWVNAPHTFAKEREALDWLASERTAHSSGRWVDPKGVGSVADAVTAYIDSRENDPDKPLRRYSIRAYRGNAALMIEGSRLGKMRASEVKVADVRRWYEVELKDRPLSQRKNAYRLLRAAFNRLVEDELLLGNPCRLKSAGAQLPARETTTTPEGAKRLKDALPPNLRIMVTLGVLGGFRISEHRGLRRQDVQIDGDLATITIDSQLDTWNDRVAPKSRKGVRTVHLVGWAVRELEQHLERFVGPEPEALLFTFDGTNPMPPKRFSAVWAKATADAGLVDLKPHDLRRTMSSRGIEAGIPPTSMLARMGQGSMGALASYVHPGGPADLAAAAALTDAMAAVADDEASS